MTNDADTVLLLVKVGRSVGARQHAGQVYTKLLWLARIVCLHLKEAITVALIGASVTKKFIGYASYSDLN